MMLDFGERRSANSSTDRSASALHIVIGITNPQTYIVLAGRLRGLRQSGFRVTLVSAPGRLLGQTAADEAVETIRIPMERTIAPLSDALSFVRLCWLLRRIKPDLTEFSTPKAGLLGTMAAKLCSVPVRVYLLRGLKLETATGFKRTVLLAAERLAAACADCVVCNSESLRAEALALKIAPADKLHVLGNGSSYGVDVERFSPGPAVVRKQLQIPDGATVLGFVGRLTRDKGVPELLEAFQDILRTEPDLRLLLVGWFDRAEDALDPEHRDRILNHPRIHYTGLVTDTAPYYRAMDVMVLPTWREGFPNAVLEAAATGIPVVTTLSTGSRDAAVPEVTGLLIPPGYPVALREAILKLIRDPERRIAMGKAARTWVIEHFANQRVVDLTARFYRELIDRKTATGSTGPVAE